jgi:hypothetical protein
MLKQLNTKCQQGKQRVLEIRLLKQKREKLLLILPEAERWKDSVRVADGRYEYLKKIEARIAKT